MAGFNPLRTVVQSPEPPQKCTSLRHSVSRGSPGIPCLWGSWERRDSQKLSCVLVAFCWKSWRLEFIGQVSVRFYREDRPSVYADHLSRARGRMWYLRVNSRVWLDLSSSSIHSHAPFEHDRFTPQQGCMWKMWELNSLLNRSGRSVSLWLHIC